ncbi:hypothetical protein K1719_000858 [Acacia pycnantha]|nr:hypothetical protein K1719_000858 [Acacia pycnantha]
MNPLEHDAASSFGNVLSCSRKRHSDELEVHVAVVVQGRKKRIRKPRVCKNKEEAETQRMTHIAVERKRRKQMNEHLAVLRSLMPESYIQRGDQASIVGGAIEFVKELEHLLQSLEAKKLQILQQAPTKYPSKTKAAIADIEVTLIETQETISAIPFSNFFTVRIGKISALSAGSRLTSFKSNAKSTKNKRILKTSKRKLVELN